MDVSATAMTGPARTTMWVFVSLFYLVLVFWLTSAAIGIADATSKEEASSRGYQIFSVVMSSLVIVGSLIFVGVAASKKKVAAL